MVLMLLLLFRFGSRSWQMTQPKFLPQISSAHNWKSRLRTQVCKVSVENFFMISQKGSIQPWHDNFSFTNSFQYVLTRLQDFVVVAPTDHDRMLLEEFKKISSASTEFFGHIRGMDKKRCSPVLLKSKQYPILLAGTRFLAQCVENNLMRCISCAWSIDAGNCSFIKIYSKCTLSIILFYEVKLPEVLCWIKSIWSVMLNLYSLQPKSSKCSVKRRSFWEEKTAIFHSFNWLVFVWLSKELTVRGRQN